MKELGIVRRLYYRDGLSLSEIERRTGLTRKTIRHWLKVAEGTAPKYQRKPTETKIAPFSAQLTKMLETDLHRPKRERRSALKLFEEIKSAGFSGDYSRVTAFIRQWRERGGPSQVKATYRCASSWGKPFSSTGAKSAWSSVVSGARSWRPT